MAIRGRCIKSSRRRADAHRTESRGQGARFARVPLSPRSGHLGPASLLQSKKKEILCSWLLLVVPHPNQCLDLAADSFYCQDSSSLSNIYGKQAHRLTRRTGLWHNRRAHRRTSGQHRRLFLTPPMFQPRCNPVPTLKPQHPVIRSSMRRWTCSSPAHETLSSGSLATQANLKAGPPHSKGGVLVLSDGHGASERLLPFGMINDRAMSSMRPKLSTAPRVGQAIDTRRYKDMTSSVLRSSSSDKEIE